MHPLILVSALSLLAAAPPATGEAQATPPLETPPAPTASAATPTQAPAEGNEVVCRDERVNGSWMVRNRVCRTRAMWAEVDQQRREAPFVYFRTRSAWGSVSSRPPGPPQ
jgi:hypothetical protein